MESSGRETNGAELGELAVVSVCLGKLAELQRACQHCRFIYYGLNAIIAQQRC